MTNTMRRLGLPALMLLLGLAGIGSAQAQDVVYYHTDALGTPVVMTDSSGNVITGSRREFEPYGRQLSPTPVADGPGYTGHVSDAATGLVYMQQRYYDPLCGCFLSSDPETAYGDGDMRLFNRYAYAFNNPYKFNDPDGRCPSCLGAIIGGGLELGLQVLSPSGRASYAAAGAALARGDIKGAWTAAGANVVKVAASAVAGAAGAGLAGKIAQAANLASRGVEASAATKLAVNTAVKIGGNGTVGAGLGAAAQGVGNLASGRPATEGMAVAAAGAGVGGMAGASAEIALRGPAQNLADSIGVYVSGRAGVAAPGAETKFTAAAERFGAFLGAFAEKAATSKNCNSMDGC